jgi:hypothetical protein
MIWQITDTDQTPDKIEKVENKRPNYGLICENLYSAPARFSFLECHHARSSR